MSRTTCKNYLDNCLSFSNSLLFLFSFVSFAKSWAEGAYFPNIQQVFVNSKTRYCPHLVRPICNFAFIFSFFSAEEKEDILHYFKNLPGGCFLERRTPRRAEIDQYFSLRNISHIPWVRVKWFLWSKIQTLLNSKKKVLKDPIKKSR